MRRKILAVDFDDTLFWTSHYSFEYEPNWPVIKYVRKRQKEGWIIILWTCRYREESVAEAVAKCEEYGIKPDYVNENAAQTIERYGDPRKILCDELIDDTVQHTVKEIYKNVGNLL